MASRGRALELVNERELKLVPGRESDVRDCQWIAHLLACGFLKSSFVPQRGQRQLRDLTRHRAQLHGEHTRCANRIQKVPQDANIKLSSVATDILGRSGRDMLAALTVGHDDPAAMADLARGKLRKKIAKLKRALTGHVMEHHQFMLEQLLDHLPLSALVAASLFADDSSAGGASKLVLPIKVPSDVETRA